MIKGGKAWLGLAAYIVAYDYYACKNGHETMSGAFTRALNHKYAKLPALIVMALVVKHLAAPKVLPKVDPLNRIATHWRGDKIEIIPTIILVGEEGVTSSRSFPRSIPS